MQHVYANMTNFGSTFWDFTLHFAQIFKRGDQEELDQKVSVTLPWIQAKALSIYLQLNLFMYEKAYGKIDVPSQFLPPSDCKTTGAGLSAEDWEVIQKKLEQILATMADLGPP
jgi:Protein of unknown function (DUF3467)